MPDAQPHGQILNPNRLFHPEPYLGNSLATPDPGTPSSSPLVHLAVEFFEELSAASKYTAARRGY